MLNASLNVNTASCSKMQTHAIELLPAELYMACEGNSMYKNELMARRLAGTEHGPGFLYWASSAAHTTRSMHKKKHSKSTHYNRLRLLAYNKSDKLTVLRFVLKHAVSSMLEPHVSHAQSIVFLCYAVSFHQADKCGRIGNGNHFGNLGAARRKHTVYTCPFGAGAIQVSAPFVLPQLPDSADQPSRLPGVLTTCGFSQGDPQLC